MLKSKPEHDYDYIICAVSHVNLGEKEMNLDGYTNAQMYVSDKHFQYVFSFSQNCSMEAEEHFSGIQSVPLAAGDLEAAEALMSMTKHRVTLTDRFRPLTPSSEVPEDCCAPLGSAALRDSSLVSV